LSSHAIRKTATALAPLFSLLFLHVGRIAERTDGHINTNSLPRWRRSEPNPGVPIRATNLDCAASIHWPSSLTSHGARAGAPGLILRFELRQLALR
jgi:hypothetical protein